MNLEAQKFVKIQQAALEIHRSAEVGVTQFFVDRQRGTYRGISNLTNPYYLYFTDGSRSFSFNLQNVSTPEELHERVRRVGDDIVSGPIPQKPGVFPVEQASIFNAIPEGRIAELYDLYTRLPRAEGGLALGRDEFTRILQHRLTPEEYAECCRIFGPAGADLILWDPTITAPLAPQRFLTAQVRASLENTDPRRNDARFLHGSGIVSEMDMIIFEDNGQVRRNIELYEQHPRLIAALRALRREDQISRPDSIPGTFDRLDLTHFSISISGTGRFPDTFSLSTYIEYLAEMTRYLRVYDRLAADGKLPKGLTLRNCIEILSAVAAETPDSPEAVRERLRGQVERVLPSSRRRGPIQAALEAALKGSASVEPASLWEMAGKPAPSQSDLALDPSSSEAISAALEIAMGLTSSEPVTDDDLVKTLRRLSKS